MQFVQYPTIVEVAGYIAHYMKRYYYTYRPNLQPNYSQELHERLTQHVLTEYMNSNNDNTLNDKINQLYLFGYETIDFERGHIFSLQKLYAVRLDLTKHPPYYWIIETSDAKFFYFKEFIHDWVVCIMDLYHY